VVNSSMELTKEEFELLEDIKSLAYGELYDVEIPEGKPFRNVTLTKQSKSLIETIRSGYRFFNIIQVHLFEPAYAESPGETSSGFRYRKRHKFLGK